MKILVTGAAGFIGYHVCLRLLEQGHDVVGVDSLNDYYDVRLKENRLRNILNHPRFAFACSDLASRKHESWMDVNFDFVIHLAAQAGVRYSKENPASYFDSNLQATFNLLENCKRTGIRKIILASSSSVYGGKEGLEWVTLPQPRSFYAATKMAVEIMASSYSKTYNMDISALRFFSVYGPWGRPDMALGKFSEALFKKAPIIINGTGEYSRDFTYIDDVVESITRLMDNQNKGYEVFNVGTGRSVTILKLIEILSKAFDLLPVSIVHRETLDEDAPMTIASTSKLESQIKYRPQTSFEDGIKKFAEWWRKYYAQV